MRPLFFITSLLSLLLSHSAQAESDLTCTITGVSEVSADGALEALAGKKIITKPPLVLNLLFSAIKV